MTQNNSSKKNEVNLNQIFNLILDAKILFISIIILSTAIATYIAVSKPILFNSIAVIELGHYYDSQGNKKQIENIHELVDDLKAEFNYKKQGGLEIFAREPKILQVETKPSIDNDSTLMNELINSIEGRHKRIVNDYYNEIQESYSSSIVRLNNEVSLLDSSRVSLIENEVSSIENEVSSIESSIENEVSSIESSIENEVSSIENEVSSIESSIENEVSSIETSLVQLNNEVSLIENSFFSEIKNINNEDLRLQLNLKYQYDFLKLKNEKLKLKNEKLKLENEKLKLEKKLKSEKLKLEKKLKNEKLKLEKKLKNEKLKLENKKLKLEKQTSFRYDIFKLKNQISTIVNRKKLLQEYEERTVFTSLIDEVISEETKPKQTLIVILGFIAGLTISIFLVYIRYVLGNIIRK